MKKEFRTSITLSAIVLAGMLSLQVNSLLPSGSDGLFFWNFSRAAGNTAIASLLQRSPVERLLEIDNSIRNHPLHGIDSRLTVDAGVQLMMTRQRALSAISVDVPEEATSSQLLQQNLTLDAYARSAEFHRTLTCSLPSLFPCTGRNASDFGGRLHPILHRFKMHTGQDIAAPTGTPIYAPGDGVVSFAGRKNGYGNAIIIDHGLGYQSLYGHCSELLVHDGQAVKRGDIIARVGATGLATGPHLHYEVIVDGAKVDPSDYLINRPRVKTAVRAADMAACPSGSQRIAVPVRLP